MHLEQPTKPIDLNPDLDTEKFIGSVVSLPGLEPRAGDTCPNCKSGRLEYDGLLNLSCQQCSFALAGCPT